jgi:putative membrane protein
VIRALVQVVLNGIGLLVAAYLVPGVHYEGGLVYLLLAGVVIGLINLLVKPLVTLLSLPLVVLTLGLFFLVINGAMLWLAAKLLSGLSVDGCMAAILGGLVMGLFNWVVGAFAGAKED